MTADQLLSELGKTTGLGSLALDGAGVCRLVFDGVTSIDLERSPDDASLHLHASLGPVPAAAGAEFYALLLAGNLYGRDTSGNVLSVLPMEHAVFLCRTISLELVDAVEFAETLAEFVRQARRWEHKIHVGPETSAGPEAPNGPVDLRNMVRV